MPDPSTASPTDRLREDRRFFGHPLGLLTLFTTELWERFSYYGMRAILLLYLTTEMAEGGLGLDTAIGQSLVTIYGTGVYLLTIVGGWLADRMIGARRSVLYGGIVIAGGHVVLAIPGAVFSFAGVVLVAIGTGLLKANVSSMVGELYEREDPRRDSAFSLFYMGINIGSFFSPFIVGFARGLWGFHAGFLVAAVGMAFAIACYVGGRSALAGAGDVVPNPIRRDELTTLLAPRAFRGQAMGLWFLAPAAGTAITAQVVQVTQDVPAAAYFGWTGAVAVAFALILVALAPWVIRHVRSADAEEGVHTAGD